MRPPYEAVFFDAGQTLIRVKESVGHVYAAVAGKYGVVAAPETIEGAFRRVWEERRDALHECSSDALERQWWHDLVRDAFSMAGGFQDFQGSFGDFFAELYDYFRSPGPWQVFDDVGPALAALARLGIRRAVVSNWDSTLAGLLDRLGLVHHFEFVLTSAQAGHRKPDPRIFHQALARMGLAPGRVVHVGDSYEDDFLGARAARVKPMMLDRNGSMDGPNPSIRSLAELPDWLEGRCAGT